MWMLRLCGCALLARTGAVRPHFDLNHEYSTRFAVTVVVREHAVDAGNKRAPRRRTVSVAGDAHDIELSLSVDTSQFAPTYAETQWSAAGIYLPRPTKNVCEWCGISQASPRGLSSDGAVYHQAASK